jgi:hypothetical protein
LCQLPCWTEFLSQYLDGQWYNATTCPGDTLYNELAGLHDEAWSRLPDDEVRFEGHDTPTTLHIGQTITASLNMRNAGVAPWSPNEVTIGYRWFNQEGVIMSQETEAGSISAEVSFGGSLPLTVTLTAPPMNHWRYL